MNTNTETILYLRFIPRGSCPCTPTGNWKIIKTTASEGIHDDATVTLYLEVTYRRITKTITIPAVVKFWRTLEPSKTVKEYETITTYMSERMLNLVITETTYNSCKAKETN